MSSQNDAALDSVTAGTVNNTLTANDNWERYEYGRTRGHREYCEVARECENFYLGGGKQWSEKDRALLEEQGRPALEFNQVKPKINSAIGYQIHNRMDIAFRPRGGQADDEIATTLSKVAMQVADNTHLHWKETQVFADGLIQQRGYYDMRVSYRKSMLGEIVVSVLDPLDVIPDPDAKSYDPDEWADVIVLRWLTFDEIEEQYGSLARQQVQLRYKGGEADFGHETLDEERNKFGDNNSGYSRSFLTMTDGSERVRIIDRQYWRTEETQVAISMTGDIRVVEDMAPEKVANLKGVVLAKRRMRRVRWCVTTQDVVLHDEWSPYNHFTVVPYFPFFRRGVTRGLVDDAIGPQKLLNKSLSQFLHVINTTANSGWITWANTLNNMTGDELEERGAETGLHLELKKDTDASKAPVKIKPNEVPQGLERIVERATSLIDETTGINQAMQGDSGPEVSGIAIQSRQYAAQQNLAVPLDNLQYSRNMLAGRMLELIQGFYDAPRIIRITENDERGRERSVQLPINYPDAANDSIINNLTIGEYDVVISEVPMQVTFENSQFQQVLELLKAGVQIPPQYLIRYSMLADKQELIDAMEAQAQEKPDPLLEAKVALTQAQTEKTKNEAVNKSVEALYSAMQSAGIAATMPQVTAIADAMLKSAGYVDHDAAPIVPPVQGQATATAADLPHNTHPLTPANPGVGLRAGLQTPQVEAAA